jgi:hypothetical protein
LDDDDVSKDDHLDVFRLDDDYEENEKLDENPGRDFGK